MIRVDAELGSGVAVSSEITDKFNSIKTLSDNIVTWACWYVRSQYHCKCLVRTIIVCRYYVLNEQSA